MTKKKLSLKLICILIIVILIAMLSFLGYKLSYNKSIEKINSSALDKTFQNEISK